MSEDGTASTPVEVGNVVTALPKFWMTKAFWVDAGERVGAAFIIGFIATITSTELVGSATFTANPYRAAAVGGIAAALSAIKAIVGGLRKNSTTSSASIL